MAISIIVLGLGPGKVLPITKKTDSNDSFITDAKLKLPKKYDIAHNNLIVEVVNIVSERHKEKKYNRSFYPTKLKGSDGVYMVDKLQLCHKNSTDSKGRYSGCENPGNIYLISKKENQ